MFFKLGKYYFPSGSGGTISLHHSLTPLPSIRHFQPGGGGGGWELIWGAARAALDPLEIALN